MDPLWNNFHIGEASVGETYCSDADRNNVYSSDDELNEIEQALLQRIHYAEHFDEDGTPSQLEENQEVAIDSKSVINHSSVSKITVEPARKTEVKSSTEKDLKGGFSHSEKEETVKRSKVQTTSKILVSRKEPKEPTSITSNDVIVISSTDHDSGSDTESKYKVIGKKSSITMCKLEDAEKHCVVSGSSNDDVRHIERDNTSNKLDKTKPHVSPIIVLDDNSDSGSCHKSDVTIVTVKGSLDLMSNEDVLVRKRHWNKSKEDSGNMKLTAAETSQKVKLKRTCIDAKLRTISDFVKENSSDDCSSDVMMIESHSEDEALDLHCDSNTNAISKKKYSYNRSSRGRYYRYKEPAVWQGFKCFNCLDFGHAARDCRKPRKVITCVLCGTKGHNDAQCPDALCYVCSEPGHQARDCPDKKDRYATCRRCSMSGHREQRCPDRWRQYHLTTEPGEIKHQREAGENKTLVQVNGKVYCYNCSQEGHFGHECWEEPMDRYAPLILPYVVKYDYIPKRFWNVQVDCPEPPVTLQTVDQIACAIPVKEMLKSKRKAAKEKLKSKRKRLKLEQARTAAATAANDGEIKMAFKRDKKQKNKNKKKRKEQCEEAQTAANGGEIKLPPMVDKKQKMKNKKRKKEQCEEVQTAANGDKKQKIKNRKRKKEQCAVDNEDEGKTPKAKKHCKRAKEEVEDEKMVTGDLSSRLRKKQRKMNKGIKQCQRKGSLNQDEVLQDLEETKDYVCKGGHVLRKRVAKLKVQNVESTEIQKKEKWQLKKEKKRKLQRQKRQKKRDKQQQQQVTFQPKLDQFLKLEKEFRMHSLDPNHTIADIACSNSLPTEPSVDPRKGTKQGGRKKKKKQSWQKNEGTQDRIYRNFLTRCTADKNLHPKIVLQELASSKRTFKPVVGRNLQLLQVQGPTAYM